MTVTQDAQKAILNVTGKTLQVLVVPALAGLAGMYVNLAKLDERNAALTARVLDLESRVREHAASDGALWERTVKADAEQQVAFARLESLTVYIKEKVDGQDANRSSRPRAARP